MDENSTADASSKISPDLSREEIIQKRRERRKLKQDEKKILKEKELLEKKLNTKSEKLQLINSSDIERHQKPSEPPKRLKLKRHRVSENVNLLDFVVEKRKQSQSVLKISSKLKKSNSKLLPPRLSGKRRDGPKKRHYTRMKKTILQNREARKLSEASEEPHQNVETVVNENVVVEATIWKLETLEICPKEARNKFVHSRKFRSYCDNTTSVDLCKLTENLLKDLFRFQKRAYEKNEIKGRAHRRYVVGLKEVHTQLNINKIKLIVIAPDCESCDAEDGLDENIDKLKEDCKIKSIPYVFALRRRQLGYVLFKKVPVTCVGVLNYDGAQDTFRELLDRITEERSNYIKHFKEFNSL